MPSMPAFATASKERQATLLNVVTERHAGDRGKDLPKDLLASDQGQTVEIVPVQVNDVKDLVDQVSSCAIAPVVLQRLKARMAFVIQDHDLPIDCCLVAGLLRVVPVF